jgi:hypothetical protein
LKEIGKYAQSEVLEFFGTHDEALHAWRKHCFHRHTKCRAHPNACALNSCRAHPNAAGDASAHATAIAINAVRTATAMAHRSGVESARTSPIDHWTVDRAAVAQANTPALGNCLTGYLDAHPELLRCVCHG